MVVQHAGAGAAVSGASSGCQLSNEELTVTCLAPLPLELQLLLSIHPDYPIIGLTWDLLNKIFGLELGISLCVVIPYKIAGNNVFLLAILPILSILLII